MVENSRLRRAAASASACVWVVWSGGCVVGPDYRAPHPVLPNAYTESSSGSTSPRTITPQDRWWSVFNDPILDMFEQQALRESPELSAARARILQARAMQGIAGALRYPTINSGALYQRTHGSQYVPIGVPPGGLGPGIDSNLWQSGFDASWELDVFGQVHRTIESANAAYSATVDDRNDVALTLVAEVARNYIELRTAQRELQVARLHLGYEKDTLGVIQSLLDAGLVSSLDELRARAQVADIESKIPAFEAQERAAAYRLATLVGSLPETVLPELTTTVPVPAATFDPSAGLPSELLQRRPDIRAAEWRLAAANARIGVAQADLYPHFYLTGLAGLESLSSTTFIDGASHYFAVGPSLTWRVFDAGKVRFQVAVEQARTDEAAAVYQRVVLTALSDVETALITYGRAVERHEKLVIEVSADLDAVKVATRLYKQGVVDFLSVLDAQRTLQVGDDELAQSERDAALAIVSICKALGGGWATAGGISWQRRRSNTLGSAVD